MKHWIVNYSVKYHTGVVEEHTVTVEAESIAEALGRGQRHVDCAPRRKQGDNRADRASGTSALSRWMSSEGRWKK